MNKLTVSIIIFITIFVLTAFVSFVGKIFNKKTIKNCQEFAFECIAEKYETQHGQWTLSFKAGKDIRLTNEQYNNIFYYIENQLNPSLCRGGSSK